MKMMFESNLSSYFQNLTILNAHQPRAHKKRKLRHVTHPPKTLYKICSAHGLTGL